MEMTNTHYVQGYCDAIIAMHEGLDYRINVKADVHINFFGTMDVTINWRESYHPETNDKIGGYMVFGDRKDMQSLGFDLLNFLDTQLSKIKLKK